MKKQPKIKQTITAHRGASGLVDHENTIEAFQKAIDVGAHAIELDVRMTKDQKIIVHHDDHIDNNKLNEKTFVEIQALAQKQGYKIPTLEEVVRLCRGKIMLDVELKETGYEEEVLYILLKHMSDRQFYIRSFNHSSLRKIEKQIPSIKTGLLLGVGKPKIPFFTRFFELYPLFPIMHTRCDFVSPHYRLLRFGFVKRMRRLGIPIVVWTVNDEALMKKLLFEDGVDGIVTDYPDIGLRLLTEHEKQLASEEAERLRLLEEKRIIKLAKKRQKQNEKKSKKPVEETSTTNENEDKEKENVES